MEISDSEPKRGRSIDRALTQLKSLDVKLLAIDFDLTMINRHTGGRWKDSPQALAKHVRPLFKELIPLANEFGIMISIVTFSSQVDLIRRSLDEAFIGDSIMREMINNLPIQGFFPVSNLKSGKKKHITNVRKEIKAKKPNLELSRSSILLIDDDLKNIDAALNDGYKAIGFNPYNPEQLLEDMMNLSSSCT
eukprot:CAMPEP_0178942174 /NCGR_PEP_ID=MMETSP0789-20121207/1835_1 /TAXON_ID=3005 /ORGANISM="Rhizosolenia setigera, Strain CCMP 1694" /LENGTH=191 /DNA_ID=CAMNT_0020621529 /DNA_START=24 /DNA_END=599 /DNA_ORIENTATION=+